MQNLAHLLLTHELGGSRDIDSLTVAMERACDTLRRHLTKLMGVDGFTLTDKDAAFAKLREICRDAGQ